MNRGRFDAYEFQIVHVCDAVARATYFASVVEVAIMF